MSMWERTWSPSTISIDTAVWMSPCHTYTQTLVIHSTQAWLRLVLYILHVQKHMHTNTDTVTNRHNHIYTHPLTHTHATLYTCTMHTHTKHTKRYIQTANTHTHYTHTLYTHTHIHTTHTLQHTLHTHTPSANLIILPEVTMNPEHEVKQQHPAHPLVQQRSRCFQPQWEWSPA